jgi:hypothetical protein
LLLQRGDICVFARLHLFELPRADATAGGESSRENGNNDVVFISHVDVLSGNRGLIHIIPGLDSFVFPNLNTHCGQLYTPVVKYSIRK